MLKRTLQDAFAEGSAKENEILERLGTQKHERVIGELELKRQKLENKAMEKQHQREHKCEQREFHMVQMRMMMIQNQQTAPTIQALAMQPPPQPSLDFGLMSELTLPPVPPESSSSLSTPYSI
jgi:hypothetical protein